MERPKSTLLHQNLRNTIRTNGHGLHQGHDHHKRLCEMRIRSSIPARKSWIRTESVPKQGAKVHSSKLEYGLTSTYLQRLRSSNPALFETLSLDESQIKLQTYKIEKPILNNKLERTKSKNCKKKMAGMKLNTGDRQAKPIAKSNVRTNAQPNKTVTNVKSKPGLRNQTDHDVSNNLNKASELSFDQTQETIPESVPVSRKSTTVVKILPMVDLENSFQENIEKTESIVIHEAGDVIRDENEGQCDYELEFEDYEVESDFEVDAESPVKSDENAEATVKDSSRSKNEINQTQKLEEKRQSLVNPVEKSFEDFEAGLEQESDYEDLKDSKTSLKSDVSKEMSVKHRGKSPLYESKESTFSYSTSDNTQKRVSPKLKASKIQREKDSPENVNSDLKSTQKSSDGQDLINQLLSSSLDQSKMRELLDIRKKPDSPKALNKQKSDESYDYGSDFSENSSESSSKNITSNSVSGKSNLSTSYRPTFG